MKFYSNLEQMGLNVVHDYGNVDFQRSIIAMVEIVS